MAATPNPLKPEALPLSLYIHIPWCIKKCPYCDFNSHAQNGMLPEQAYVEALIKDFDESSPNRPIETVFFGGGTPSLFSAHAIERILSHIFKHSTPKEITLEANPGTFEQAKFRDFRLAGVNRISLGVQSFDDRALSALGRVHSSTQAKEALTCVQKYYDQWNLDLMYGLPQQTLEQAQFDLKTALSMNPPHLSWYQLTLEPNTYFYKYPPVLPQDDHLYAIHEMGHDLLAQHGYFPYEVSALTQNQPCQHNLNYWQFGDYLGIGAGAHSKLTTPLGIFREMRHKYPKNYLDTARPYIAQKHRIQPKDLPFEFMLNALRLNQGVDLSLFTQRTGLPLTAIHSKLEQAVDKDLLSWKNNFIAPTTLGQRFLNDLMELFLPDEHSNSLPNAS